LKERIMVVAAALAWNTNRYHPMVEVAVGWLKKQGDRR
jgi:hypothetical protein